MKLFSFPSLLPPLKCNGLGNGTRFSLYFYKLNLCTTPTKSTTLFTELAPRPIQSIIFILVVVCL